MKASELTSRDLMVGDWLMSFGAPHKVVGIRTDMLEPHIKTDMSDTWYEEGIENLLEPIPLTPEILKKNGFSCDGYAILRLEDNSELLYYFHEYKLTRFYKSEIIFRCQCVYAHELQHALKLCGIDKNIIV
jgi:hypothetical protein